ncbi:MAG: DUF3450 domain-containing protein [Halieaceae bacterium]|jgi:hypothetical protein|nr:DUF3450 domain-containing protein [Halieaceae bacterium]
MSGWLRVLLVLGLFSAAGQAQEKVQEIEQQGIERAAEGRVVQKKVTSLRDETRTLVDDYYAHLKLVDGLKLYNAMLQRQLDNQAEEIDILTGSIAEVATVERQILPLMSRMIDGLEHFIGFDVPFLLEERTSRVEELRALLPRADVTVAEKTRRVMEAYQIENDYGRTIEAYRGKLDLGTASFDADFLRVGRVALMYRLVGGDQVGFWDHDDSQWVELSSGRWRRYIDQGLKVARQEVAPELISVAIDPQQEIQR